MAYQPSNSFALDVSRGAYSNMSAVNKFGRNPDVDIGTEDIWSQGGTWVAPTAARVHAIVSSSTSDASAGVGARTVMVNGLNGSFADTTETVTMNGTTPVNTVNSFVIIHRMIVLTVGSSAANVGTITATAATDATISCAIVIAKAQSQFGIYQIPAGYSGYLFAYGGSFYGAANTNLLLELFAKPSGGAFNLKGTLALNISANCVGVREYAIPTKFTAQTTIKVSSTSDTNNANVIGWFDLVLVAD